VTVEGLSIASSSSNVRWVLLSQGVKILAQLLSVTVLTRFLPPRSYGVMALAMVATNFAFMFRDMGSAAAIIQARRLTSRLSCTLYWANIGLGLALMIATLAISPIMVHAFGEKELSSILMLLSLAFPIASLSVVPQALLERESRFEVVVVAEVVAAILGVIVVLIAARLGAGVYSLALQMMTTTCVTSLLICVRSDFRPRWIWSPRAFRSIIGFSANLSIFNFVNYLSRNADSLIVGKLLGSSLLGIYTIANRIMLLPQQNFGFVISRALFPLMSRQHDKLPDIAELYLRTLALVAFVSAPLMAGLFALREPFVDVFLGPNWQSVGSVLAWMAPIGYIQSLINTTGTIPMARGRTGLLLRLGILGAVLHISAFVIGARWGITGVAATYLLSNLLNAWPAFRFTGALVGVTIPAVVARIAGATLLAVAMALLLRALLPVASEVMTDSRIRLAALVLIGMLFYFAGSLWFLRSEWRQLRELFAI
jgi:O-antigen/teichoic acid export membrane protein